MKSVTGHTVILKMKYWQVHRRQRRYRCRFPRYFQISGNSKKRITSFESVSNNETHTTSVEFIPSTNDSVNELVQYNKQMTSVILHQDRSLIATLFSWFNLQTYSDLFCRLCLQHTRFFCPFSSGKVITRSLWNQQHYNENDLFKRMHLNTVKPLLQMKCLSKRFFLLFLLLFQHVIQVIKRVIKYNPIPFKQLLFFYGFILLVSSVFHVIVLHNGLFPNTTHDILLLPLKYNVWFNSKKLIICYILLNVWIYYSSIFFYLSHILHSIYFKFHQLLFPSSIEIICGPTDHSQNTSVPCHIESLSPFSSTDTICPTFVLEGSNNFIKHHINVTEFISPSNVTQTLTNFSVLCDLKKTTNLCILSILPLLTIIDQLESRYELHPVIEFVYYLWTISECSPLPSISQWKSYPIYIRIVESQQWIEHRIHQFMCYYFPDYSSYLWGEQSVIQTNQTIDDIGTFHKTPYPPIGELYGNYHLHLGVDGIHPIDTDLFKGLIFIRIKGIQSTDLSDYFKGRKRLFQVVIQGSFKKKLRFDQVYSGQVCQSLWKNLPSTWLIRLLTPILSNAIPSFKANFLCQEPYILFPLISSFQVVNIIDPRIDLPPVITDMNLKENVLLLGEPFTHSSWAYNRHKRRSYFSKMSNLRNFYFEPEFVYTMETYQHIFNIATYSLELPFKSIPLSYYLNHQPIEISAFIEYKYLHLFSSLKTLQNDNDETVALQVNYSDMDRIFLWKIQLYHEQLLN